ncbi:MAG: glycosyltransferase [Acidobacteria bacterium]|nr:MAG: glycosyltransferase [Acidobacteriota bacterium]
MTGPHAAARLVVFLRWPEPGRVKTRLIPRLGPDGAARVYERLARRTLDAVAQARTPGLTRLALVTPDERVDAARALFGGPLAWAGQGSGDLGRRLARAFGDGFAAGAPAVVAIGSDCPDLDGPRIDEAFARLAAGDDAVLGPARDGGYYLIGLRHPCPVVFDGIPWSTDRVLEQTRARLRAAGARWSELPVLHDVDVPDDLPEWCDDP